MTKEQSYKSESRSRYKYEILTEPHEAAQEEWPSRGKHILAQFDNDSIVLYKAFRKEIVRLCR